MLLKKQILFKRKDLMASGWEKQWKSVSLSQFYFPPDIFVLNFIFSSLASILALREIGVGGFPLIGDESGGRVISTFYMWVDCVVDVCRCEQCDFSRAVGGGVVDQSEAPPPPPPPLTALSLQDFPTGCVYTPAHSHIMPLWRKECRHRTTEIVWGQ